MAREPTIRVRQGKRPQIPKTAQQELEGPPSPRLPHKQRPLRLRPTHSVCANGQTQANLMKRRTNLGRDRLERCALVVLMRNSRKLVTCNKAWHHLSRIRTHDMGHGASSRDDKSGGSQSNASHFAEH